MTNEMVIRKDFDLWLSDNTAAWRYSDEGTLWLGFQAGYQAAFSGAGSELRETLEIIASQDIESGETSGGYPVGNAYEVTIARKALTALKGANHA